MKMTHRLYVSYYGFSNRKNYSIDYGSELQAVMDAGIEKRYHGAKETRIEKITK